MDIYELGKEYNSLLMDEDELDDDDRERLEDLRKLNDEMYDALYHYSSSGVMVIKADETEKYAEDWICDVMGVDLYEQSLNWYFDFQKYWEENLEPDWDEIEWEGTKYLYRAW